MKNRIRQFLVAAVLGIVSQGAWALGDAWYVAGGLGASFPDDVDVTQTGVNLTTELDTGAFGSVAFGRIFGNFRAEAELAASVNDVSTLSVPGAGGVTASGDVTTSAFMVNAYYDFPTDSKWMPFVGGGIGGANVSINNLSSMGFFLADDNATVFAYQVKVGVGYAFTDALDGTVGYRYFGTDGADFVDSTGVPFSADGFQAHVIEFGVRYRF